MRRPNCGERRVRRIDYTGKDGCRLFAKAFGAGDFSSAKERPVVIAAHIRRHDDSEVAKLKGEWHQAVVVRAAIGVS